MYKIEYKNGNVYSRRLTPEQREFADEVLRRLAACPNPSKFECELGMVKPLGSNHAGEYSFKPTKNLRAMQDLEIRIVFKPSEPLCRILVIRVAPRDEVYK